VEKIREAKDSGNNDANMPVTSTGESTIDTKLQGMNTHNLRMPHGFYGNYESRTPHEAQQRTSENLPSFGVLMEDEGGIVLDAIHYAIHSGPKVDRTEVGILSTSFL
jgi:hypothetical protein